MLHAHCIAIEQVKHKAFKVAGLGDVHGGAGCLMGIGRTTHPVNPCSKELIEHIVFVGGHNEMLDRQAHHAGHMACAHIAKVATWHTEADFLRVILRGLKIARKVIHHLR